MTRRVGIQIVVTGSQQAKQVLSAFSQDLNRLQSQANAFYAATNQFQRRQFPGAASPSSGVPGLNVAYPDQQLKVLANTIKVTTDASIKLADGTRLLGATTTSYTGDLQKLVAAQAKYDAELANAQGSINSYKNQLQGLRTAYQQVAQAHDAVAQRARERIGTGQGRLAAADLAVAGATRDRDIAAGNFARAQSIAGLARNDFAGGVISQSALEAANIRLAAAHNELAAKEAALARVASDAGKERYNAQRQIDRAQAALTQATLDSAKAEQTYTANRIATGAAMRAAILPGLEAAKKGVIDAYNASPPLPPVLQQLSSTRGGSPQLLNQLLKGGLGGGAQFGSPAFIQNLIGQGAYEGINLEKDLVRNVTRVTGSFNDAAGVVNRFSAEFDKSGRVITRFGGQLSGIGNVLNQISRDFQKVIEFAVATTVVFGTLRFAIEELRTITAIDKNLRQLGITANLTGQETRAMFEDISDIAINTATPLVELTKATDDIALATRRAGQSSREWREDILSLTNSVGILTNLAGIDTVKATDVLVSTMKQLGLEAEQLPGILNKITAVAGGQSNAIADIIQGLGVMAEAGKQAGLTVDEQIAAVQTLSQVTSKSPAEVATSFKNLVGSLTGVAGRKALKEFDIALLDSAGNLRNILDIYSEISDKIKQGVIPENQVQALVRAIAGGPRRAPDAAALLSAIDEIQKVTQRSINATNEALLANAKILDSNQSKFVQIQNRLDKFATTKFADILNESLSGLAEVLDRLLGALEGIDTGFIAVLLQLGLFAIATKFAVSIGRFFLTSIGQLVSGLTQLSGSLLGAAEAQAVFNAAQAGSATSGLVGVNGQPIVAAAQRQSRLQRLRALGGFKSLGGPLAIGGLAGAVSAGAGLSPQESIGAALQTAGIAAAISVPIPHIKALGLVLAGAGTIMQLFGNQTEEATEAIQGNTEAMLNALSTYKTTAEEIKNVADAQKGIGQEINKLLREESLSAEQQSRLNNLQQEYAEGAAQLIGLNQQLSDSFKTLSESLGDNFPSITAAAAAAGVFSPQQLKEVMNQLAPAILSATNPNFVAPADFNLPGAGLGNYAATSGSTIATGALPTLLDKERTGSSLQAVSIQLKDLETDASKVLQLFSESGDDLLATFDPSYENLQLIDTALLKIKEDLDPAQYERLRGTFQAYASDVNALFAAERNVALYSAYLEAGGATGLFTQEQVNRGLSLLDIYQQLINLGATAPQSIEVSDPRDFRPNQGITQRDILQQAQGVLQTAAGGGEITREQAVSAGETILKLTGQFDDLEQKGTVLLTIAEFFKNVGIEVVGLTDRMEELGQKASETNVELLEGLAELDSSILSSVGQKLADLQARFQGGEFKGNEGAYRAEVEQLEAIASSADKVVAAYTVAAETYSNLEVQLAPFKQSLTEINGLQDAESLTTDALIGRLFTLAETYGLTGDQVVKLSEKLFKLLDALKTISAYRAKFGLTASVDASSLIKFYQALNKGVPVVNPYTGFVTGFSGGGSYSAIIKELQAAQSALTSGGSIGNLFSSGGGSSFGTRGGSGTGSRAGSSPKPKSFSDLFDVSTLDIPEEILNAPDPMALIQKAIKNARKLQSQIPGATAEGKNDIVALLKGTQRILEVRGVKDDLLRKALEELADIEKKRLEFETKADTIRRIRVGGGDFAAIANVPLNSRTGVSLGGQDQINVTLNVNGQILTPAQLAQFADLVAASIKRQIAS